MKIKSIHITARTNEEVDKKATKEEAYELYKSYKNYAWWIIIGMFAILVSVCIIWNVREDEAAKMLLLNMVFTFMGMSAIIGVIGKHYWMGRYVEKLEKK